MPHTFELFSQIWPRGLDNPELFLHCVFQIHRRLQVGQQVDPSQDSRHAWSCEENGGREQERVSETERKMLLS